MTLYNYRSDGTITKFDSSGNVEASYLVSNEGCTCPAGHRHTCRHRQMLPSLEKIVDTHWFLNWNTGDVCDFSGFLKSTYDAVVEGPMKQDTPTSAEGMRCEEDTFLEGLSQTAHTTFIYTTDEPPLPITDVRLNVSCNEPAPAPAALPWRRI